jgi:hypothetical protein
MHLFIFELALITLDHSRQGQPPGFRYFVITDAAELQAGADGPAAFVSSQGVVNQLLVDSLAEIHGVGHY